jgi:hypothetical protein
MISVQGCFKQNIPGNLNTLILKNWILIFSLVHKM